MVKQVYTQNIYFMQFRVTCPFCEDITNINVFDFNTMSVALQYASEITEKYGKLYECCLKCKK
jgi:hypothetical protein